MKQTDPRHLSLKPLGQSDGGHDRLHTILQTMDHLEQEHLASTALVRQVQAHCKQAGLEVSEVQVAQAMDQVMENKVPADSLSEIRRPREKRRIKAIGSWLLRWSASETMLVPLVLLAALWVGHRTYGETFNALLASSKFSGVMLLCFGIFLAHTLFQGTVATAKDGGLLGEKWSSIWVPIKLVFVAALLMPSIPGPAHQAISAVAYLALKLLGA